MVCVPDNDNGKGQAQQKLTRQFLAQEAMAKFTVEKDIAQHIKKTVRSCKPCATTIKKQGFFWVLTRGSHS